jgi:hypothetical protein
VPVSVGVRVVMHFGKRKRSPSPLPSPSPMPAPPSPTGASASPSASVSSAAAAADVKGGSAAGGAASAASAASSSASLSEVKRSIDPFGWARALCAAVRSAMSDVTGASVPKELSAMVGEYARPLIIISARAAQVDVWYAAVAMWDPFGTPMDAAEADGGGDSAADSKAKSEGGVSAARSLWRRLSLQEGFSPLSVDVTADMCCPLALK